jgi:hypothetical protein
MNEISEGKILLPVLVLVAWTFAILFQIPIRRFKAVFNREVSQEDFELGESEKVSAHVALANRNYMNLLELPVLFYAACLILFLLEAVTYPSLVLAWAYVILRIVHSLIHVTYNNVAHRLTVFGLSNLALLGIWLLLIGPMLDAAA